MELFNKRVATWFQRSKLYHCTAATFNDFLTLKRMAFKLFRRCILVVHREADTLARQILRDLGRTPTPASPPAARA